MRLATIRTSTGTACVRVDDHTAVETGHTDVGILLRRPGWRELAADAVGVQHDVVGLDYAPLVPMPDKIICVGLNYLAHRRDRPRASDRPDAVPEVRELARRSERPDRTPP